MSRFASKITLSLATLLAAAALSSAANAGAIRDAQRLNHDRGELRFNRAEGVVDRFEKGQDIRKFEADVAHGNIVGAIREEQRIGQDNRRIARDNRDVAIDRFNVGNDRRRLNNDFNNF